MSGKTHTWCGYKASSKDDLSELSVRLTALPNWVVLAHVHDLGLMRCRQQPLSFLMWLVQKFKGIGGLLHFFYQLKERSPDVISMWHADMMRHMHLGRDTEDADSVGGWSQREINLLVSRFPQHLIKAEPRT